MSGPDVDQDTTTDDEGEHTLDIAGMGEDPDPPDLEPEEFAPPHDPPLQNTEADHEPQVIPEEARNDG